MSLLISPVYPDRSVLDRSGCSLAVFQKKLVYNLALSEGLLLPRAPAQPLHTQLYYGNHPSSILSSLHFLSSFPLGPLKGTNTRWAVAFLPGDCRLGESVVILSLFLFRSLIFQLSSRCLWSGILKDSLGEDRQCSLSAWVWSTGSGARLVPLCLVPGRVALDSSQAPSQAPWQAAQGLTSREDRGNE